MPFQIPDDLVPPFCTVWVEDNVWVSIYREVSFSEDKGTAFWALCAGADSEAGRVGDESPRPAPTEEPAYSGIFCKFAELLRPARKDP